MRYYININNTYDQEITCSTSGAKLTYTKDNNSVYLRASLTGDISFRNGAILVYDLIYNLDICDIVTFRITECDVELYNGYFYKRDCKFDEDSCIVSVTPNVLDKYTYVSKIADKKFNILAPSAAFPNLLNWHIGEVVNDINYEYVTINDPSKFIDIYYVNSTWSRYNAAIDKYFDIEGSSPLAIATYDGINIEDGWTVISTKCEYIEGSDRLFNVTTSYAREAKTFVRPNHIIGDAPPNTEVEDGWVLLEENSMFIGQTQYDVWVRRVQGISSDKYEWNTRSKYNLTATSTVELTTEIKRYYRQCIMLNDVIKYILKYVDIPLNFKSEFLTSRVNPVSGKDLSSLALLQKTLARDVNASNLPTIGNITLNDILSALANIFQVYPSISGDDFVLEHISYYDNNLSYTVSKEVGYDLTIDTKTSLLPKRIYSFENSIPIREKFAFQEATDIDFIGTDISYEDCLKEGSEINYNVGLITTQIDNDFVEGFSDTDPNFMLLQLSSNVYGESRYVVQLANGSNMTVTVTGYRKVISEQGAISGIVKPNAHLSWANLHESYWKTNRYLPSGKMNDKYTEFTQRKSKIQDNVRFQTENFNPLLLVRTNIGDGEIVSAEYSFRGKMYNVKLKY